MVTAAATVCTCGAFIGSANSHFDDERAPEGSTRMVQMQMVTAGTGATAFSMEFEPGRFDVAGQSADFAVGHI